MNFQELAAKDKASGHDIRYHVYFNRKTSNDCYHIEIASPKNPEKAYRKMIRDIEERFAHSDTEDTIYYQICRVDWDLYRDFTMVGTFEYKSAGKMVIELAPEAYGRVYAY
jgi:hypothetical protein